LRDDLDNKAYRNFKSDNISANRKKGETHPQRKEKTKEQTEKQFEQNSDRYMFRDLQWHHVW
jgi:hypothetical protein